MSVEPCGMPLARQCLPTSMDMSALFTQQSKQCSVPQCARKHGAGVLQQYAHQATSLVLKWGRDQTTPHALPTEAMMPLWSPRACNQHVDHVWQLHQRSIATRKTCIWRTAHRQVCVCLLVCHVHDF